MVPVMCPVMCLVQEGQVSREAERRVKAQVDALTRRAFSAPAQIDWVVVPVGSGFSAAVPSRAVVVALHGNRPLVQAERAALLQDLADACMRHTGLPAEDVVTSVRNPEAR